MWVNFRRVLRIFLVLGVVTLGASFAGALHPLGDSLAVFRVPVAFGTALVALGLWALGQRIGAIFAIGALAVTAPSLWLLFGPGPQIDAEYRVYQKNLSFRLRDARPLVADIRAAEPDVLTLQEVANENDLALVALEDMLPHQIFCPFLGVGGVAVASRWPKLPGTDLCLEGLGLAGFQAQSPGGPIWLLSVHLHWPFPHRQAQQMDVLIPVLAGLDGPVVLGGDFNMVPWSNTHRRIAAATRSNRAAPNRSSFPRWAPFIPLPIDHVYAPRAGVVTLRPLLGSDHLGLLVQIAR